MEPIGQGWDESRKAQWRIERLLEQEVLLLRQIVALLTPAPEQYQPTVGIVVIPK